MPAFDVVYAPSRKKCRNEDRRLVSLRGLRKWFSELIGPKSAEKDYYSDSSCTDLAARTRPSVNTADGTDEPGPCRRDVERPQSSISDLYCQHCFPLASITFRLSNVLGV